MDDDDMQQQQPHLQAAGWILLDRSVHVSTSHPPPAAASTSSSATSDDCTGRPIHASLTVADPPAPSRLHLHWPGRQRILHGMVGPSVVAADGHSILFKAIVPFKDPSWNSLWHRSFFPVDYFVYSSSPPSLTRLPPCFVGVDMDADDKHFTPYRRQQQRVMLDRGIGLLCHGGAGEFTVADVTHYFAHHIELCLLRHTTTTSSSGIMTHHDQWSVKRLEISSDMAAMGLDLTLFDSDVVFPVAGRFLAWVDYYQGMLLVDVLHDDHENAASLDGDQQQQPQQVRFIPLPAEALMSRRPSYVEEGPDSDRCVGVTGNGIIKFVCVCCCSPSPAFTIETWTLADIEHGGVWEKDDTATMDDNQFFGLLCRDDAAAEKTTKITSGSLPRVQPCFPMVSLADPDVVFFVLEEVVNGGSVCRRIVEVNMRTKVLQSAAASIVRKPCVFGHSFISTKFSSSSPTS